MGEPSSYHMFLFLILPKDFLKNYHMYSNEEFCFVTFSPQNHESTFFLVNSTGHNYNKMDRALGLISK